MKTTQHTDGDMSDGFDAMRKAQEDRFFKLEQEKHLMAYVVSRHRRLGEKIRVELRTEAPEQVSNEFNASRLRLLVPTRTNGNAFGRASASRRRLR